MNKNYWVYSPEFRTLNGPYSVREAMRKKGEHDNFEEKVLILKTVIGIDGKEVK